MLEGKVIALDKSSILVTLNLQNFGDIRFISEKIVKLAYWQVTTSNR